AGRSAPGHGRRAGAGALRPHLGDLGDARGRSPPLRRPGAAGRGAVPARLPRPAPVASRHARPGGAAPRRRARCGRAGRRRCGDAVHRGAGLRPTASAHRAPGPGLTGPVAPAPSPPTPGWDDVPMPSRAISARPRPPSLRDVAELAGVSIKTVSNVVNDYPHVRETTRERVRAAILESGYRPQVAARQLRTGAGGIITLAVPSLMFSYFSALSQHFIDEAQRRGQTVVLHSTSAGPEAERTVLEGFQRIFGDGVIFNPLFLAEEQFAMMQRTTQPTVFIGEHLPETLPQGSDYARIDNRSASYDATRHLLSTGRRHLAFLGVIVSRRGQQPHSSGILRRDGFLAALREEGLPAGDEMVQAVEDWHREHGFAGAEALLERCPDLDGIVC